MNFQTKRGGDGSPRGASHRLLKFSKLPFDSVFWINSGAEANENAFKLAFKMLPGRTHVAAVEQSFHGRTAACASTTWQAPQKWFFLPRAPFDVSWIKRRDIADIAHHVTANTAAVIVEPVQGVGGAFDMGQEFLSALRKRCDETGALLIFDEVQCGVGRTGQPFAANYYGVMPDMITTAKAWERFPVSALLLTPPITRRSSLKTWAPPSAVAHGLRRSRGHHRCHRERRSVLATFVAFRTISPRLQGRSGQGFQGWLSGWPALDKPAKDIQKARWLAAFSPALRAIRRSAPAAAFISRGHVDSCAPRWRAYEQLPSGQTYSDAGSRATRAR